MITTRPQALANPLAHKFIPGEGYVRAPELKIAGDPVAGGQAAPPKGTKDGTRHWLRPPGASKPIDFQWQASNETWINHFGRRVGFTAEYLTHYGWKYESPQDPTIFDQIKGVFNA